MDTSPDFVGAITYCLAYDHWRQSPNAETLGRLLSGGEPRTDDEHRLSQMIQLARLVAQEPSDSPHAEEHQTYLQHIQDAAGSLDNPKVALLMGGATKIKQYVFESARLPEIRGASALLDHINLVDLPALFNQRPHDIQQSLRIQEVREQFARRYSKEPPDCPACVIYANGGELLAFSPTFLAQELADAIEFLYTSETFVANSVAVCQSFSLVELAGGVDAIAFWQRWGRRQYQELLIPFFSQHGVNKLPKQKCFGELAAALAAEKFRRREGNPRLDGNGGVSRSPKSIPQWETFAYSQRCRSCERRLASRTYTVAGEPQPVCGACYRKLDEGWAWKRAWVVEFETFLWGMQREDAYYRVRHDSGIQEGQRQYPLRQWDRKPLPDRPQDLNEIGQASQPSGYIGVIYADGNNMGALLETLRNAAEYHHFANAVYQATQGAVFEALSTALYPAHVDREVSKSKREEKGWIHPFEILSIGGDDLFLIVPAHTAIPIAIQIAQEVERRLSQDPQFQKDLSYDAQRVHRCALDAADYVGHAPQSAVALSVGVLLADAKTPIFFLQDLVGQLLKSAKARAKDLKKQYNYYGGTIDFMALKSVTMITSKLREFRDSSLRLGQDWLTARPYTLMEMQKLLDTVRELKAVQFPRSQLYALRRALWEGRLASTVDYLYFTERLGEKDRNQLRTVLDHRWCSNGAAPWQHPASAASPWETVLVDIIELYDFVEGRRVQTLSLEPDATAPHATE